MINTEINIIQSDWSIRSSGSGLYRSSPYEKTWLTGKACPPPISRSAQQIDRDEKLISTVSVRKLPSY